MKTDQRAADILARVLSRFNLHDRQQFPEVGEALGYIRDAERERREAALAPAEETPPAP
jgi:hypothetical protein